MKSYCVWANEPAVKNCAYIFSLDIYSERGKQASIKISAYNSYKFYLNGELKFFGPARSPKGHFRTDERKISLKKGKNRISVVCSAYNAANYSYVSDTSFFYFKTKCDNTEYCASDFACYDYSEKIKNAQRYSFQRGFCEIYNYQYDFKYILLNIERLKNRIDVKEVKRLKPLKRIVPYVQLKIISAKNPIISGKCVYIDERPVFNHRCIDGVGENFDGYKRHELYECITDRVSKLTCEQGEPNTFLRAKEYSVYDFKCNKTGFLGFDIEAVEDSEIYVLFDELLDNEDCPVSFSRLSCCSVIKWELAAGKYVLETIEPYTLKYCQIIVFNGAINVKRAVMTLYENSDAYKLKLNTDDTVINSIVKSAENTVAQNAVDLLMDCPSRERAGWINDVYFSRKSTAIFTGNEKVLHVTLENFILAEPIKELPLNMIPMCYPSDHLNGEYIPNCAMWYVIILCEYVMNGNFKKYDLTINSQIDGLLSFFEKYENEDGLLENLDSWIFIEWSIANSKDYVAGVNYPSNMMYYKMIKSVAELRDDNRLFNKAEKIKRTIREQSFNGEFFEDNRIRKDGRLVSLGHISEACQYYAFCMGVADSKDYPELYKNLSECFSDDESRKSFPNVGKSNVIVGLLMRITMLLENGENAKVVDEIKEVYGLMAKTTGTLWENLNPTASCNHGIAAYAGYILIRAITGFEGFKNGKPVFADKFANINGVFEIPCKAERYKVVLNNGGREIKRIR